MLEELTLRKALEFAVTTEELGARFYERMASKFQGDPDVAGIFAQLGRDEQAHRIEFHKLLEQVPPSYDDLVEYERAQYLRAMANSKLFSVRSGPFADIEKIDDAAEALRHAFEFERVALGFYQAVRDEIGKSAALDSIIAAEKQHVTQLMKVIMTGARFRSLQDEWP